MSARVGDLLEALEREFPRAWAEPWDRTGLLVGDPDAVVAGVLVSLDPSPDALSRAEELGASVLVTHHPAFLEDMRPTPGAGMAGVPFAAIARGIALVAAHTNLDRSPAGGDALPLALGLTPEVALEDGVQPVDIMVTYVPSSHADGVRAALASAGAGRIGMYEGCSFSGEGIGRFVATEGAEPWTGPERGAQTVAEVRVEAVCEAGTGEGVAAAVRAAHPYQEPVVMVYGGGIARGAARMGRVCTLPEPASLRSFAASVGRGLSVSATVWGDPDRPVERVAIAPGSGRSLVAAARAAAADVLVTGELRYHESLDAVSAGLAVIEAGHDATEWPLVPVLAECVRGTSGLEGPVHVDEPHAHWWTAEGA